MDHLRVGCRKKCALHFALGWGMIIQDEQSTAHQCADELRCRNAAPNSSVTETLDLVVQRKSKRMQHKT